MQTILSLPTAFATQRLSSFTLPVMALTWALIIRLEARLQPNIGLTFERAPYARFYRFPSAKFHEIRTQHVDRCRDESFRKRI